MMIVQIKQLLELYIIKDIGNIIINYIYNKCNICYVLQEKLLTCYCFTKVCDLCIKSCIACQANLCINCDICNECTIIYNNSIRYEDT